MNALPLETFRRIAGYHPWHFWQWANTSKIPVNSQCNQVLFEHPWTHADRMSRSQLRQEITYAESRLAELLGYRVGRDFVSKRIEWPRYKGTSAWRNHPANVPYGKLGLWFGEGEIRRIGTEQLTLIGSANVVYTDEDNDSLTDTFTATIATAVTDEQDIAVYVDTADRFDGSGVSDRWRIRPVNVSISGGIATITGPAWIMARPILYQGYAPQTLDPDVAGNYLPTIAVYVRTANSDESAELFFHGNASAWLSCCGLANGVDVGLDVSTDARVSILHERLGFVSPVQSIYDAGTGTWSSALCSQLIACPPDYAIINAESGLSYNEWQEPQGDWAEIISRLLAAEINRPICTCETANAWLGEWQKDLSQVQGGGGDIYATSEDVFTNRLGRRRGHVYVSSIIKQRRINPARTLG